ERHDDRRQLAAVAREGRVRWQLLPVEVQQCEPRNAGDEARARTGRRHAQLVDDVPGARTVRNGLERPRQHAPGARRECSGRARERRGRGERNHGDSSGDDLHAIHDISARMDLDEELAAACIDAGIDPATLVAWVVARPRPPGTTPLAYLQPDGEVRADTV